MGNDPCHKNAAATCTSVNGYTFAQCARTGVTQAVWDPGGPGNSPARSIQHGHRRQCLDLDPESSDTYSYGFILNPNFLDNVTLTVDYYDIKVENAITSVNGETTLTACINGNDAACAGIHRNAAANDSLWLGNASTHQRASTRSSSTAASSR